MDLNGKRALVTGGTRGIGAAIAVDLARGGADVALNGRNADVEAEATRTAIADLGRRAELVVADLADPEQAARCVAETEAKLGPLDILVHSAGGPAWGRIEDVSPEQWRSAFDIHVHAAYHLCRDVLPGMRARREGAILLISSVAGLRGCPGAIAYGTVKGAVLQFTRMLARDVADDNVRVNCVAPGVIRTRFHDAMTAEQREHNLRQRIPLHREGTPADVAQVARTLITSEFMTGEVVVVDGGMTSQIVR